MGIFENDVFSENGIARKDLEKRFDEDISFAKQFIAKENKDFSLKPFAQEISLKGVGSKNVGFFASFNELANEYIRQNENHYENLVKFKYMNPLEQRNFLYKNLQNIINGSGEKFTRAFREAENNGGKNKEDFILNTGTLLKKEIDYLSDNATKNDLEFQRYKDILGVPNWTNKALNDFLQEKKLPLGANTQQKKLFDNQDSPSLTQKPFNYGESEFGNLMIDFKPDEDKSIKEQFYETLKNNYNKNAVEDRFGSTPLAKRFENKQKLSERGMLGNIVGTGSQLLGVPYFNTIEQAKESGVLAPDEWGSRELWNSPERFAKNAGESIFDAALAVSPYKVKGVGTLFNKLPAPNNLVRAFEIGAIAGGKGALEGEELASGVGGTLGNVGTGVAAGIGGGSLAYGIGRVGQKYTKGAFKKQLEKLDADAKANKEQFVEQEKNVLDGLNQQIKQRQDFINSNDFSLNEKQMEEVLSEIRQMEEQKKALEARKDIFSSENLKGLKAYARNIKEPTDPVSAKNSDVIDWMQNKQKTHLIENPEFVENIEVAPYEVIGLDYESPLQNLRRPSVPNTQSPSYRFFEATGYNPSISGVPSSTINESNAMTKRAGDYILRNPEYEEKLSSINPDLKKNKTSDYGRRIFNEMKMYEDEPIANFIVNKEKFGDKTNNELVSAYKEWLTRNYPNGVDNYEEAQRIFNEKLSLANKQYWDDGYESLPTKYNTGRIKDSEFFKIVKKNIEQSSLDGKEKQKLFKELNEATLEGKTEREISETIANVLQKTTGTPQNYGNIASSVREAVTPNTILKPTFDRANALKLAEEKRKDLFNKRVELQKKIVSAPDEISAQKAKIEDLQAQIKQKQIDNNAYLEQQKKILEEKKQKIRNAKEGFVPPVVHGINLYNKSIGYANANVNANELDYDVGFIPYSNENEFMKHFKTRLTPVLNMYDSPLMKMRSAGSFNIPNAGAKK